MKITKTYAASEIKNKLTQIFIAASKEPIEITRRGSDPYVLLPKKILDELVLNQTKEQDIEIVGESIQETTAESYPDNQDDHGHANQYSSEKSDHKVVATDDTGNQMSAEQISHQEQGTAEIIPGQIHQAHAEHQQKEQSAKTSAQDPVRKAHLENLRNSISTMSTAQSSQHLDLSQAATNKQPATHMANRERFPVTNPVKEVQKVVTQAAYNNHAQVTATNEKLPQKGGRRFLGLL